MLKRAPFGGRRGLLIRTLFRKQNSGFYKAAPDFTDYADFMDDSIPERQQSVESVKFVAAFIFFWRMRGCSLRV